MNMPYFPYNRADTFPYRALYMYLSSKSGSRRGLGDMVCGFSPEREGGGTGCGTEKVRSAKQV